MTGYGYAEKASRLSLSVEIKSYNNRYLKSSVIFPPLLSDMRRRSPPDLQKLPPEVSRGVSESQTLKAIFRWKSTRRSLSLTEAFAQVSIFSGKAEARFKRLLSTRRVLVSVSGERANSYGRPLCRP